MEQIIYTYRQTNLDVYHLVTENPLTSYQSYMHAHDDYELFYLASGDCRFVVEGTEYPLQPGDMMLMRPAEAHCLFIQGNAPYERFIIQFNHTFLKSLDPAGILLEPYINRNLGTLNRYTALSLTGLYEHRLLRLRNDSPHEDDYQNSLYYVLQIADILYEIRGLFKNRQILSEHKADSSEHVILDYINTHLEEDLSADRLGRLFYMSKSQLGRRFRSLTGASLGEYVRSKRLILARQHILAGMPATTVSRKVGYLDYSAFYRAYRDKYGCPPSLS